MSAPATPDSELTLSFESQRAVVSPWGASLRRYAQVEADGREIDVLWGYSGGNQKKGGQGDVLCPFPGRIPDGRYTFDGETYQLDRNDKEGPNAIHGFVRTIPWETRECDPSRARFEVRLETAAYASRGYPFSLRVSVTYALDGNGLACEFEVENVGTSAAPVGIGFHPYFTVGTGLIDEAEAKIPCRGYLEFNDRLVPTGRVLDVEGTEWDFRERRLVGARRFNHCLVNLVRDAHGIATALLRHPENGRQIEIAMDRAFTAIVVYTGDAISDAPRRALAIEPMTCATDAFNRPEWGLKRLRPQALFTGRYRVRATLY